LTLQWRHIGAAHASSPDVRSGHPGLRSLDADCAPASCLRRPIRGGSVPEQRRLSGPGQPLTDSAFETVRSNVLSVSKKPHRRRESSYLHGRRSQAAALFVCRHVREKRASRAGFCSPVCGGKKYCSASCFRGSLTIPLKKGGLGIPRRVASGGEERRRQPLARDLQRWCERFDHTVLRVCPGAL
jgi:hypothetical protein